MMVHSHKQVSINLGDDVTKEAKMSFHAYDKFMEDKNTHSPSNKMNIC